MTDAEKAQLMQIIQTAPPYSRQQVTIGDRTYYVQVPAQINSETSFAMVGYGAGGVGDTIPCYSMAAANQDNTVLMSIWSSKTESYDKCVDGLRYVASQYGNTSNPTILGYSMTGKTVILNGAHQTAVTGTPSIIVESQPRNPHGWKAEEYNAMKDSTIITFDDPGYEWYGYYSNLAKAGANVFKIEAKGSDHGTVNDVTYATGIYKIGQDGLDLSSLPTTIDMGGYSLNVKYKFKYWDSEGNLREFNSVEEAQAYLDNALEKCGVGGIIGKLSDYQFYDPNSYQSSAYKLDTTAGNNSVLASDLNVVMDGMNELSTVIKGSSLQKVGNTCTSTTSIPTAIFETQNYLMGVHSTLSDNIGKETAVIANVAQAVYNLDAKLAQSTSGINGQVSAEKVNATLDKILNTDITIPYAQFASPVSIEKTTQGHAGKLCVSDIDAMLKGGKLTGAVADSLAKDTEDAQAAIKSIKAFQDTIASKTSLQGDIWKEVNAKLDNYNNLLDKRIQSNEKMQEAYEKALQLLKDYMGDYDELDDAKIPELKAQVTKLKEEIQQLQAQIDEMKTVCTTDKDGNESCHQEHVYSDAERAKFSEQIKQNEALIEELNAEIAKLEGLWEVINQAADIINGAVEGIKSDYSAQVGDVAVAEPEEVLASTDQNLATGTDTSTGTTTSTGTPTNTYGNYSPSSGYSDYGGYSGYNGYGTTGATIPQENTAVSNNTIPITNVPVTENNATTPTPEPNQTIINNYYYNNGGGGGGGRSHVEAAPAQTDAPVVEETPVEAPVVEEPIPEPIIEEVVEEPIVEEVEVEPEVEPEEIVVVDQPQVVETATQKSGSALKTVGVLAGVGLAAGAAAYAAHEMSKSKEESDDAYESENDYSYDDGSGYY